MSTYLIGDVQGCFNSLQALLKKIAFNPRKDRLGFVGDLVNRGPKSLDTLRFLSHLKNPLVVLGNHDLHLLALYFLGASQFTRIPHSLNDILHAPDCYDLIQFVLQQPLLYREDNMIMVHAGIPPQWSIDTALQHAAETAALLQKNPVAFFENIYGNEPYQWHDGLRGWDRARYCVNAFTRMRFCDQAGALDLENKTDTATSEAYRPWFAWVARELPIYFGHWASLNGQCDEQNVFALDTGCAWGGKLTAICIESGALFTVDCCG